MRDPGVGASSCTVVIGVDEGQFFDDGLVVHRAARGLQPVEIARSQLDVVAQRIPVAEAAGAVLEKHAHRRQPGMRMGSEGRLGHGEVIDHDQRVHQTVQLAMGEAERFEARAPGHLLPVLDRGDRGAGVARSKSGLLGHVRLLC